MAKDALGHGSNGTNSGGKKSLAKPIPGHPYHKLPDASLRYIMKDASEAAGHAQAMGKPETKYNDQVNDAATVLGYRSRGGSQDLGERAASDLASGPKSAPIPMHDSMGTPRPSDNIQNAGAKAGYNEYGSRHGYNPASVDKAISNASRFQGKVSGGERSAIHRLLKGR